MPSLSVFLARIFDVRLYVLAMQHKPTYFVTYNTDDFKNLGDMELKTPEAIL